MLKVLTAAAFALATLAGSAYAEVFPDRTITLVVPYPPGGSNDLAARVLATGLTRELKQTVVVENRAGAGGNIGATSVARAAPDGYTLLMISSAHVANRFLYASLTYDLLKDFSPVSRVALNPNVLVVPADSPSNSLREFADRVKSSATPLTYGSAGSGTGQHLAGALFANRLGAQMTHVPYRGGAPAITDLLGGRVDAIFAPLAEIKSFLDAKKLKALAVTTPARTASLPGVPTVSELLPGFELTQWNGIAVPAGTPRDRVAKLAQAIKVTIDTPSVQQALAAQAIGTSVNTPEEFKALLDTEAPRWAEVVRISGAQAN